MSITDKYSVRPIESWQCREWLLYKHYAKRVPSIEYSFGLYKDLILIGVCCFGSPPKAMNNGDSIFNGYKVKTLELNRLCVNDGLEKNALSYFVSKSLNQLPKPCCVVSYADSTVGHHGYIYQATNWIYTGLNQVHEREWFKDGKEVHSRTLSSLGYTDYKSKVEAGYTPGEYTKKHRYLMFLGSKSDVKKMSLSLVYEISPYPKGDNRRYDSGHQITVQGSLF